MVAKYIVDTNVPKIANQQVDILAIPENMLGCVLACVEKIQQIISGKQILVLDEAGEIFEEYRKQLSMSGQPGIGDAFMQWVHDRQWMACERVAITKTGAIYHAFPTVPALEDFDKSDRKFVALANTHPEKPPIVAATGGNQG